jgi:phosphatidylglycerophosphatase A
MGSLAAIPLYLGLARACLPDMLLLVIVAAFAVGVPICNRTGHWLGKPDHPAIVWDEVVAMWIVLYTVPPSWLWYTAALCLFRLFDITKPWPIRVVDQRLKNGFGVMLDDLLAALYTMIFLAAARVLVRNLGNL